MNDLSDGVNLSAAADAEGGHHGEGREEHPQPLEAQTPFQGVHSAPLHFPVGRLDPVFDADKGFCVLGGDTEHAGNPAPEHRARSAQEDGGAHADDVAGADGGGQSGGQGLKLAHIPRRVRVAGHRELDAGKGLALNETGAEGHKNVGAQQEHNHGDSP